MSAAINLVGPPYKDKQGGLVHQVGYTDGSLRVEPATGFVNQMIYQWEALSDPVQYGIMAAAGLISLYVIVKVLK